MTTTAAFDNISERFATGQKKSKAQGSQRQTANERAEKSLKKLERSS
ncbi:hypothetical protein [Flavonifractor sp. An100]|nr:hypothetical protein [Flavonifractor sp. An100]